MGSSTYAITIESVGDKEEFVQLEQTRQEYNILELDYCG